MVDIVPVPPLLCGYGVAPQVDYTVPALWLPTCFLLSICQASKLNLFLTIV